MDRLEGEHSKLSRTTNKVPKFRIKKWFKFSKENISNY